MFLSSTAGDVLRKRDYGALIPVGLRRASGDLHRHPLERVRDACQKIRRSHAGRPSLANHHRCSSFRRIPTIRTSILIAEVARHVRVPEASFISVLESKRQMPVSQSRLALSRGRQKFAS